MQRFSKCIAAGLSLLGASSLAQQPHLRASRDGDLPNAHAVSDQAGSPAKRHSVAQVGQIPAPSAPIIELSTERQKQADSKLLSTASMIGPMENASSLFSRLQIPDDWRKEEEIIPTGTRESQDMIVWNSKSYTWTSPVFYHRPLYYEQPNLERYGNGPRRLFQPAISSAHFFMSTPMIPVKMLFNAPWSDIYTLGEGRPGNWVPWQKHTFIEE